MKLLVLGANGFVGKALVERALDAGHHVTAFVRDPSKVTLQNPALRVVRGDVLDPPSLQHAVEGHDVVFFLVGPGHKKESTVRTEGARNTVRAMTQAGVKRLFVLSGLGAGVTRASMGFFFNQVLARTSLKGLLQDQNGMEGEVRKSKLEWIVVRAGEIIDGEPTMKWVVSWDGTEISRRISRGDIIAFMLGQLEGQEFVHRPVALGAPDVVQS